MSMTIERGEGWPELLPVPALLREVPISRAMFYKLVRAGEGPTLTRIGDRVFISRKNLAAWLAKHEVGPEARAA
jgi:hypothetical protein